MYTLYVSIYERKFYGIMYLLYSWMNKLEWMNEWYISFCG